MHPYFLKEDNKCAMYKGMNFLQPYKKQNMLQKKQVLVRYQNKWPSVKLKDSLGVKESLSLSIIGVNVFDKKGMQQ